MTTTPRGITLAIGARRAESAEDFELIRVIRNAGREWMADQREISAAEQATFRASFTEPVWLYFVNSAQRQTLVGWGLVKRWHDGVAYVSLAVAAEHRSHGYGSTIYADLRRRWKQDREIEAICRADNIASIRAAQAAGFVITERFVGEGMTVLKATTLP